MLTFGMAGPAVTGQWGTAAHSAWAASTCPYAAIDRPGTCSRYEGSGVDSRTAEAGPPAAWGAPWPDSGVSKAELTEPLGFWGVLKIFGSKNLRPGLAVVNNLLEAWGRNFSTQKKS